MTTSADLGLPYIASSQAQPEVTHNDALNLLQAMINGVVDRGINTPAVSPTIGDSYIIGASPTGAWAGRANCVTIWNGTAWDFIPGETSAGTPITMGARQEGMRVWVRDEDIGYVWSGSAWSPADKVALQEEGSPVLNAHTLNFTGAGATVTDVGGVATVDIPGGGGGQSGVASSLATLDFLPLFQGVASAAPGGVAPNSITRIHTHVFKLDSDITITDLAIRVVSASAGQTIDIAIYEFLAVGKPGNVVAKAQCSTTSTGVATGTVGTPVALTAGLYFVVMHASSTTPTLAGASVSADLSLYTLLRTDGYSNMGGGSTLNPSLVTNDTNLPGGSYTYGMDLTGLSLSAANSFDLATRYFFAAKKQ